MQYKIPYKINNKYHAPDLGDVTLFDEPGIRFDRFIHERVSGRFAIDEILREAVECFGDQYDDELAYGHWRCEFWGKLILSACRVCRYKRDERLKEDIRRSAYDLLQFQRADGYLSTYRDSRDIFRVDKTKYGMDWNWNVWGRKYTLWGLIECAQLLDDAHILACCERLASQLIDELAAMGVRVKDAGVMDGMPACSILKPMLILYRLTGNNKYYDFALDIVKEWEREDNERPNLITNAQSDTAPFYWYEKKDGWCSKAYEMMSCFDGICELYRVSGDAKYLNAAEGLYRLLIKNESNILGSVGYCEHFEKAASYADAATEICDVIHWMRLCYELFSITGKACYMESFEKAYVNAFLAGVYEDGREGAFFVRSAGRHWRAIPQVGTKYQHCCINNIPRGFANAAEAAVMVSGEGYFVNLYTPVIVRLGATKIHIGGGYFDKGRVTISVREPEAGKKLFLRIPVWSKTTTITVNGVETQAAAGDYAAIELNGETVLNIVFDMTPEVIDLPMWQELPGWDYHVNRWCDGENGLCDRAQMLTHPMSIIRRGPVLLARSKRVGCDEASMFDGRTVFGKDAVCTAQPIRHDHMLCTFRVTLTAGDEVQNFVMCDYASAANRDLEDVRYFTIYV